MKFNEFKNLLFDRAEKEGFEEFEIYYRDKENFETEIFKGEIDKYSINFTLGVCFRGIYKGQMGYAFSEVMNDYTVNLLIDKAKENASVIERDSSEEIFEGDKKYIEVDAYNDEIKAYDESSRIQLAKSIDKAMYEFDSRVDNGSAGVSVKSENIKIVNSKGLNVSDRNNMFITYIDSVVKDEKNVNDSFEFICTRKPNKLDTDEMIKNVVESALKQFNASSIPSGKYKTLFHKKAAAIMLNTFAGIFNGEQAEKGLTLLKDKVSEQIASELVTIKDSSVMEDGIVMRSFDDEGVACVEKKIIEKGTLKTLLHNRMTAQKFNTTSTGNGFKNSYADTVSVKPTNIFLEKGNVPYEDMIKAVGEGVIITKLEGMHSGANTVTGDFSLGAKGFLIKGGNIVKPVEQITIAGNYFDMLKDIIQIGEDFYLNMLGGYASGSPSIIVRELSIAGE